MKSCGLDFGTSNSGVALPVGESIRLLPLEDGSPSIPSAVFFATDPPQAVTYGRAAMREYLDGTPGRLMRSLKSLLGSSLIDEMTAIGDRSIAFTDVLTLYLRMLRERAMAEAGRRARHRGARAAGALRRRRCGARREGAGHARVLRARRGIPAHRVPVRADRGGVRLRADDRARGGGAGDRRGRRHRRLHGDPPGAGPPRPHRPRAGRAGQRRHPHRRHRLRLPPQPVVGDAHARLRVHRAQGPRDAEPDLLRPVHVAPDQPALRRRRRARRCASCRRSSATRFRTNDCGA